MSPADSPPGSPPDSPPGSPPGSPHGSPPRPCRVPPLPPDERDVLVLLARGHTVEAVAARLGVSVRTVGRREAAARARLGVGSRMAAAAEAARQGII